MRGLKGKVAIITGAGSGIGQGIAKRLGCEGSKVIVDYVGTPEGAEETERAIKETGGEGEIVRADITKLNDINCLVNTAWDRFGSADFLINNAGVEKKSEFWDTTEHDYDLVMNVNLRGPFFLTQSFVRRLRDAKKPGRIVNISSVHEDMVFPGFDSYSCSKGGLRMLMRNLSVELGPLGITVNNVAPGAIATPINKSLLANKEQLNALLNNIPLGRMGTPDDVAGLVAFLVSEDAAYITGSTFVVDGGLMRNYREQ
ncbi:SDR family NAD(P)-dependent oxidoreductase [Occallatibacter riparius]|uniref:Glucose 1-dehydrogenase n=1 Tax=Occallatibacter riparius TaxID=1002689 RepID=A0A9J7BIA5_9BACT|nr:glucose 1-dehydrogenase [Occallatibacter riparius]UWZ82203.1 glucose 1-dehydrogenase [Occallatibacter riparius]